MKLDLTTILIATNALFALIIIVISIIIVLKLRKPETPSREYKERLITIGPDYAFTSDRYELYVSAFMLVKEPVTESQDNAKAADFRTAPLVACTILKELIGMAKFGDLVADRENMNNRFAKKLANILDNRWNLQVIMAGIDNIELTKDAQKSLNQRVFIEQTKMAGADDMTYEILKLRTFEKVADKEVAKILNAQKPIMTTATKVDEQQG